MPHEYPTHPSLVVLENEKEIQESVFEKLCVVCDGQMQIVFLSLLDLQIYSWEFYAKTHEDIMLDMVVIAANSGQWSWIWQI